MELDKIVRNSLANVNSVNTKEVSGLAYQFVLDMDILDFYKDQIIDMLDNIFDDGEIVSFNDFTKTKGNIKWGTSFEGELLVILGKALDLIKLLPDEDGLPNVLRDSNNKVKSMK